MEIKKVHEKSELFFYYERYNKIVHHIGYLIRLIK